MLLLCVYLYMYKIYLLSIVCDFFLLLLLYDFFLAMQNEMKKLLKICFRRRVCTHVKSWYDVNEQKINVSVQFEARIHHLLIDMKRSFE